MFLRSKNIGQAYHTVEARERAHETHGHSDTSNDAVEELEEEESQALREVRVKAIWPSTWAFSAAAATEQSREDSRDCREASRDAAYV